MCEADGHWLGKNRGVGGQQFGFVTGGILISKYLTSILLSIGVGREPLNV